MTIQLDFFQPASPAPAQRHSPTSIEAADVIAPKAGTLRRAVFDFLLGCGALGATDEDMQQGLDLNPSTQRPRRIELVRAGSVLDSGRTRPTASGRQAVVWVANTDPIRRDRRPCNERARCRDE